MSDRLLPFEAIYNFRDYGGYAGAEGFVARGRLFRSGQHARASDTDLKAVEALGISTVVDLRRQNERLKEPSRRPENWQGQVLSSDLGGDGEAPHMRFLREEDLTADSGRRYMANAYSRMPYEAGHIALFKAHFTALATTEGGSLIHCAAGKDRTGLLAALTHKVLGVSDEDMLADYLATNTAIRLEERADQFAQWLHRRTGKAVSNAAVVAFFGVEADFINNAWRAIDQTHGGVSQYLEQVLGIDQVMMATIRQRLTL